MSVTGLLGGLNEILDAKEALVTEVRSLSLWLTFAEQSLCARHCVSFIQSLQ